MGSRPTGFDCNLPILKIYLLTRLNSMPSIFADHFKGLQNYWLSQLVGNRAFKSEEWDPFPLLLAKIKVSSM